jgi:tetratricopeptide (TPR) repeat protein
MSGEATQGAREETRRAREEELLTELVFYLSTRKRPGFSVATFNTFHLRDRLIPLVISRIPGLRHHRADLSGQSVVSLRRALIETLPDEVLRSSPVEYMVHVTGLETSVTGGGPDGAPVGDLIPNMNFERELLFRGFPFIILLWLDEGAARLFRRHALDLWDWVAGEFRFEEEQRPAPREEPPLPLPPAGDLPERRARIAELEARLLVPPLEGTPPERALRSRLNLLFLLSRERLSARNLSRAKSALLEARDIALQLSEDTGDRAAFGAEAEFRLGDVCREAREFDEALSHFDASLALQNQLGATSNVGGTYHQMGRVFEEQRRFDEALENYQKAITLNKEAGFDHLIGFTYHQMGVILQKQHKFEDAEINYQNAIEWKKNAGNTKDIGSTYHQIGMLYEEQKRYEDALKLYNKSIQINKENNIYYQLGATYHQIGTTLLYQKKYDEALKNYNYSIDWKNKTGMFHELGLTYHQIGNIYHEMNDHNKALVFYSDAIKLKERYGRITELGDTYNNIGRTYYEMDRFDDSIKNYKHAVELSIKNKRTNKLGVIYHNIAVVYQTLKKFNESIEYYQKAIQCLEQQDLSHQSCYSYLYLSKIFFVMEDWDSAWEHVLWALFHGRNGAFTPAQEEGAFALSSEILPHLDPARARERFDAVFAPLSTEARDALAARLFPPSAQS